MTDPEPPQRVSLVIPVRNGARTIRPCLESVAAIAARDESPLDEIIVVDDHSTDDTADIVRTFENVTLIEGDGHGPGAARNIGWKRARNDLVWFVDADCVANADALDGLLPAFDDPNVAGSGGSYDNALPGSLLATLIHEEIVTRHERMGERVNVLATFSVVYRKAALEQLGGFNPIYQKAQDAEFAYRVVEAGHELRFNRAARVAHHHPTSLPSYLRTQSRQGYWRVFLHLRHKSPSAGDSYSSLLDHAAPPLAALTVPAMLLHFIPLGWLLTDAMLLLLLAMQLPMTLAIVSRTKQPVHLLFAPLAFARAYARAFGMTHATLHALAQRRAAPAEATP